jgi:hypothetical protein
VTAERLQGEEEARLAAALARAETAERLKGEEEAQAVMAEQLQGEEKDMLAAAEARSEAAAQDRAAAAAECAYSSGRQWCRRPRHRWRSRSPARRER